MDTLIVAKATLDNLGFKDTDQRYGFDLFIYRHQNWVALFEALKDDDTKLIVHSISKWLVNALLTNWDKDVM
jgi:hypothetical protein